MDSNRSSGDATPSDRPSGRVPQLLSGAFGILFFWFLVMAVDQGGWPAAWRAFAGVMLLAALGGTLAGMSHLFARRPLEVVAIVLIYASLAWAYLAGTFTSWRQVAWDALGILIGVVIASIGLRALKARMANTKQLSDTRSNRLFDDLSAIGYLIAAWLGVTVVTLLVPSLLPSEPQRFVAIEPARSIAPSDTGAFADLRIGLALSGGGYRAAVFHSGTLHALEQLGVRVSHLSTVSGGSIIGSYYAIGGDPVAFKDAVAEGRFNLKRELLLAHNALRLPFPMRVPGTEIRLFPWYEYSRRDVQADMLDRLLLGGRLHTPAPIPQAPEIIVNAADLTFGLIVGFLPDGILVQGPDRDIGVYRGPRYEPDSSLTLADRVSISGAFPLAFPATPLGARVDPPSATGRGRRPLQLVDGGVADNTGRDSLMNAHTVACTDGHCDLSFHADPRFSSDVLLVSDGGAIFGVGEAYVGAAQLARAVDLGGAHSGRRFSRVRNLPAVTFSAQAAYLSPDMQFRLHQDTDASKPLDPGKQWHVRFDPRDGYPDPVIAAIVDLLPEASYPSVREAWAAYQTARVTTEAHDLRLWGKWLPRFSAKEGCVAARESGPLAAELQELPGICEAAELRRAFVAELRVLLEAFRATSTLEDQLGEERTERLFRLGQLLVYRDWPQLSEAALQARCIRIVRAGCPVNESDGGSVCAEREKVCL